MEISEESFEESQQKPPFPLRLFVNDGSLNVSLFLSLQRDDFIQVSIFSKYSAEKIVWKIVI